MTASSRREAMVPARGSTFRVCLPIVKQSVGVLDPDDDSPVETGTSGLRVLITDDNVDAATSLAMLVQLKGHTAEVAFDGNRALELAETFRPDVAFLDIGMPGMSGYDVARELQNAPGMEHVRCIALTGWGTENDRNRSRQAGFYAHLTKPVELQEVERVLSDISLNLRPVRPPAPRAPKHAL